MDYVNRVGASCKVVRNDIHPDNIDFKGIKGLILSPGPETPAKAGFLMDYLKLCHENVPVLGICLGHQAIGGFFGAELHKAIKPVHGKVSSISLCKDEIFKTLPGKIDIVRYNSLVLKKLPSDLQCIAETAEGEVMALRHRKYPIWGLQFHPEAALTQGGLTMLKNWVVFNKIV